MLNQALLFLLETVIGLFSLALLLRFYLQLVRAPYRNPLSQFVAALTDWLVLPARRVIPGLWGVDLPSLLLAWLAEMLLMVAILAVKGFAIKTAPGVAFAAIAAIAVVRVLKLSVYIVMVAVIVQAVLSWINPHSPVAPMLDSLARPFLRPLQKRIPPVGGVDLSPLVLLVVLQLILIVPIAWLELNMARLF